MERSNSALKWLRIPYTFVGNIVLYTLIGYFVDKKFDIGNYFVIFILFGIVMSFYSSYRIMVRIEEDEKTKSK